MSYQKLRPKIVVCYDGPNPSRLSSKFLVGRSTSTMYCPAGGEIVEAVGKQKGLLVFWIQGPDQLHRGEPRSLAKPKSDAFGD
jgi:hypothetical protein